MPENGGIGMDIGPVHIKGLPKWCGSLVLLMFFIVAIIYTWSQYGSDIYNPISKLEAAQLTEAQRHFWEDPEDEIQLGTGGVARHYASDRCTAVQWKLLNGTTQTSFAFHPERTLEILAGPHPLDQLHGAGMMGCWGPGPGCCRDPHPPPMQERQQPMSQCVVRVWRYFPHGNDQCIHYQDFDNCSRRGGPVMWTRCIH